MTVYIQVVCSCDSIFEGNIGNTMYYSTKYYKNKLQTPFLSVLLPCLFSACICETIIRECKDSQKSQVCYEGDSYISSDYPEPAPCHVNISVQLKEIVSINEDGNTISLFIILCTEWEDKRLHVRQSEKDKERYVRFVQSPVIKDSEKHVGLFRIFTLQF